MAESLPQAAPDKPVSPAQGLTLSFAEPQATTDSDISSTTALCPSPPSQRYTLLEEIARGGMGAIWRATDNALGREVAVKVLQDKYRPDSGVASRFADEARITAQLQHPAIPPVHDLGTLPDGRPFLAMKLIKGQTLEALLGARPDTSAERGRFVAVFEQVCQAVGYAHAHGVLHRDLKPANVMVGAFGEVQVMDWGLAKVRSERPADTSEPQATAAATQVQSQRDSDGMFTQAGSVLGTPAFMPPEQAIGAVDQVDARSDVFGLGAILAVILTGRPPFVSRTAESTRQLSAKGKVQDCFARLDACGADPELLALCKECLASEKEERLSDGSVVARRVAALRAAADERARRAELERVRVEGEKAAAEARSVERRKRRRLWLGSAAALVVALLGGLGAVLYVQGQANADLELKNRELAEEEAEVESRFALAQKAIATFHTGVSEDALLKNDKLKALQTKLLREAAGFYAELEKRLEGRTDVKSRRLLASGYEQLGDLTKTIEDKKAALVLQRKALSLRRELAALAEADVETRLEVARSLKAVGDLLLATGDTAGALAAHEEQWDVATALEAESPTDAVAAQVASAQHSRGCVLRETGKPGEALQAFRKARDIRQQLADANPTVTQFQSDLAQSHHNIGYILSQTGEPAEALRAYQKARDILQKLADANPTVTLFQSNLADSHRSIGNVLSKTGKSAGALQAFQKARDIRQQLADATPAVTQFQSDLAQSHYTIGLVLVETGKPAEALQAFQKARDIQQMLADANPADTLFQSALANSQNEIGNVLSDMGKPAEALQAYQKARESFQKLADANSAVTRFQSDLAASLNNTGILLWKTGKPEEALQAFQKGREIRQKLADTNPAVTLFQSYLANNHNSIGNVLSQTGKPAEALQAFQKARDIQQKLADANPAVTQFQSYLADSHNNIGSVLSQTGKPAEALQAHQKALEIYQKLADANLTVTEFQSDLASCHTNIGSVLSETGKPAEALQEYQKARDILQKLTDANPTLPDYQGLLADSLNNLGRAHTRLKQFPQAIVALDKGLVLLQKLVDAQPANRDYIAWLGNGHAYRGAAHLGAGHPAEAAADLRRVLKIWTKNTDADVDTPFERARTLALLAGLGVEPKSGVSAAEAAAFADQAVASLQDAIKAGWAQRDLLKEPDFDPLRKRADFQNLLKKLE